MPIRYSFHYVYFYIKEITVSNSKEIIVSLALPDKLGSLQRYHFYSTGIKGCEH